ncbi:MAG: hypothetical protein ACYC2H_09980 [Thermoplasmatota archaeon]
MALLSMGAVGRRLGRSSRSVRRLVALGRLKAKRDQASGLLYVEDAEVERYERDDLGIPAETKDRRRPRRAVKPDTPAPIDAAKATTRPDEAPSVQATPPTKPEPDTPAPIAPAAPAKPATTPPAKPAKKASWTLFD